MSQSVSLPPEAIEKARLFCIDEYQDYKIYKYLAEREKREDLKRVLEELSRQELEHYEFWKSLVGECKQEVPKTKLALIRLGRLIFGLTFMLKLLERHEEEVIREYKNYLKYLQGEERKTLEEIIKHEEHHEKVLLSSLNESIVRYMSAIALGTADAIVEITGVHAGFLGATNATLVAGIAGLIVGVSAAISMAGAAYIQAKSEGITEKSPTKSAILTGVSYLITVIALALPYFLAQHQLTAFIASLILAVIIVAGFTYYNAVLSEASVKEELAENLTILFATALISYLFGDFLARQFGIQIAA
ncbi:MAG: VIT1/CCC1 transporter family protein [Desulfurococcales archaeon]|nr:VIT1/CCC1 transporter family protein [Desulfurococcales archaeon]